MKIDKIRKSSLFALAVMLALNAEAAFSERIDSDKAPNDLFFYLSPPIVYRTDSFYPPGETTNLPDFRLFYEYEVVPLFAEIGWRNHIGKLSTWFALPIRRSCVAAGEHSLGTNLPYQGMDIDTTFPFKGYLAWENDYLGLKLARDKIDIGPGYWSSVELNKQNPYWDHFQFYYQAGAFRLEHYIIRLNPFLLSNEQTAQDSTIPCWFSTTSMVKTGVMFIEKQLGWSPGYSFEKALESTVDWYLNNMEWIDSVRTGNYRK